jgi:tagatose-6-phosphate ketose/aldose isomerase
MKSHYTYREIMQQPSMWLKEYELLVAEREKIEAFITRYLYEGYQIIYTGAGSSAYIGDVLEVALSDTMFKGAISVPTTDIITNPETYLCCDKKILMISFARSGNSPESLGAIRIANSICKDIAHIYITCNAEGELAKTADKENTLLLILPSETNDVSLAMTSSFSTMMFTCMMIAHIRGVESQRPMVESLVKTATEALVQIDRQIPEIASRRFDRAVFLGSGELKGIAEESHLKLQEMTDGRVVCSFDSFLGFRHGPKAVVNDSTVMVYLFAGCQTVSRYETDLVEQVNSNNSVVAQIAVSTNKVEVDGTSFDVNIPLGGSDHVQGVYKCLPYIFVAQLLGYYKSLDFGLNPDSPSVSGNIARVVEGVTIYYDQINNQGQVNI